MRREKSNYVIQSVSHSLDVLEQFFGEADELGVTELSKRLRLHKNNVFRLLATLESRGYIEQNRATENYRLGIRCLQLGQSYVQHMGLLRQAHPIMADLVRQVRETTYLAVLRRTAVVPVEVIEADRPVRIVSQLGEALPLHCTAAGKPKAERGPGRAGDAPAATFDAGRTRCPAEPILHAGRGAGAPGASPSRAARTH